MMASLQHCLTLFHQQEDVRVLQLKQSEEKCRVLEEALNILAKEHHELEQSVVNHISETGTIPRSFSCKSSRIFDTDDEFYDAFAEDSDTDTLVHQTESIFNTPSGSVLTLLEETNDAALESFSGERGDYSHAVSDYSGGGHRRRIRRRSSSGQTEDMSSRMTSSTNTLTNEQYYTDDVSKTESTSSTDSSTTTPSSSSSSSSGSGTNVTSQSTTSYYTQQCDEGEHREDHCLVQGDPDSHDKSESNSSSDTLVGSCMSNATSCATLVSEGGNVYRCARSDLGPLEKSAGKDRDLICLKTPVRRR